MSFETAVYEKVLKPIFFKVDPELTHDMAVSFGRFLGSNFLTRAITGLLFSYSNDALNNTVAGITFPNPIGLAAGFDKNARLIDIIPEVGFGFTEIGSVTAQPCKGNVKPRMFRLPKDDALIINYGLYNDGADAVAKRIKDKRHKIPLGISIAKTNDDSIKDDASVEDYLISFKKLEHIGDYVTLNISCPNTGDGRSFEDPILLEKLLNKINKPQKPVFLKLSPDISKDNLDKIIDLSRKYGITGFVVSNLTHDRKNLNTPCKILKSKEGGISGVPLKSKTLSFIRHIYKSTNGSFVIIAVGGIFSARDAYEYIRNGASLVQLITGMIYRGPAVIKEINKGLVSLMKKDGYSTISDVIGADA